MSTLPPLHNCPDCDEALAFTFSETSGLSAWKWGECGRPIRVTREALTPTEVELACEAGHRYGVQLTDEGGLTLGRRE